MRLADFAASLRPHDVSVAIALLELIRRSDSTGVLERGQWLTAVQAAYRRSGVLDSNPADSSLDGLAPYVEQNVLARLQSEGIASGEPGGEAREHRGGEQERNEGRKGMHERPR